MVRSPLPIDPLLPEIIAPLGQRRAVVLIAEPGAGKTTRVPAALLDVLPSDRRVLVLEPRRLAARLSAERVAAERGERVGETVGFVTRFERAEGPHTRLTFVTEGILSRRLLSDPTLRGVGVVVFDEFHERHLTSDVGLAQVYALRRDARPDLGVCVMSATLDPSKLSSYLGAEVVTAQGRVFPVELRHAEKPDDRPLESQLASAIFDLCAAGLDGHVLCFLPGAREIRAAEKALSKLREREDLAVLPLFGSMPPREQDRAVGPSDRRKVILATNVAETSITIDGVVAVVDSGLANVASCSPWTGLPRLELAKVSKASLAQRAGRAGRTRPGVCVRLFTAGDFAARPAFDTPEVTRLDLCEPALELVAAGFRDPATFPWFEAPPRAALDGALTLLSALGALRGQAGDLALSEIGERMLQFPVHPRQARLLVEAERLGVPGDGAGLAALLSERPLSGRSRDRGGSTQQSDLFAWLDMLDEVEHGGPGAAARLGIDHGRAQSVTRVRAQLLRSLSTAAATPGDPHAHERALLQCILVAFPDRVGRVRRPDLGVGRKQAEISFASGGTALLSEASLVRDAELCVAVEVEERGAGRARPTVHAASAVDPDWLLELFTDRISEEEEVVVGSGKGRVEIVRTMRFGSLVLDQSRGPLSDPARVAPALAKAFLARGIDSELLGKLEELAVREDLCRGRRPEFGQGAIAPRDHAALLARAAVDCTDLDALAAVNLVEVALLSLRSEDQRLLRELAPERVALPSGRSLEIQYRAGAPPSVSSRLQDFFGMRAGPAILGGQPLVLELLAPNFRAVQVTTDLAGFWQRHYPTIAKELRRKYPRHSWPDDPVTATPPVRKR